MEQTFSREFGLGVYSGVSFGRQHAGLIRGTIIQLDERALISWSVSVAGASFWRTSITQERTHIYRPPSKFDVFTSPYFSSKFRVLAWNLCFLPSDLWNQLDVSRASRLRKCARDASSIIIDSIIDHRETTRRRNRRKQSVGTFDPSHR